MSHQSGNTRSSLGFTLLEVLMTVAVIGVVAFVATSMIGNVQRHSKSQKLENDIQAINTAVGAYLNFGGEVETTQDFATVFAKLKSRASDETAAKVVGFTGSFLDPRIEPIMQTGAEAATDAPRAYWDSAKSKLVYADSGPPGIKEFRLNEDLAEVAAQQDARQTSMEYASEDTWVWDYRDNPAPTPLGSTVISVSTVPESPTPPATPPAVVPPPVVPPSPGTLQRPVFSLPGGNYRIDQFALSLSLSNPNPPGSSKIIYAVDFGSWQDYGGSLSVSPDSTISAQAVALSGDWSDSGKVDQNYQADPAPLLPPVIDPDHSSYSLFTDYDITVSLTNPNPGGLSTTQYRIDGGGWQEYTTPFVLAKADYPGGVNVEAQAVSSGSPNYLDSPVASRFLSDGTLSLTGNTTGAFSNPSGPSGLVSNLKGGGSGPYFNWGDDNGSAYSKSWMDFAGGAFANVTEGTRFNVGTLTYYNGTIRGGTGATTIDLAITLELDINGNAFNPFFDFTFDLINSPNTTDEWASADYVLAGDPRSSRTVVIDDYEFEFRIEFGETTSNGFADFTEFHVLENKDATVNVYGTLVSLGPVTDNTDPLNGGVTTATDPGTGNEDDPLFQKDGYVDLLEFVTDLVEFTKEQRDIAKDARDDARDGANLALKGANDIAKKIDEEKYDEAAKLAGDAAAGAAEAEAAAQIAESALVAAQAAEAKAIELTTMSSQALEDLGLNPSDVKKQADEVTKLVGETATFAAEARAFADAAAADAAIVAAIWEDFQNTGPESDPEGYVEFLSDAAKDAKDTAKNTVKDAEDAADDATKAREDTAKKIEEGKYADAQLEADNAAAAAALAEEAAQIAEAAAVQANTYANQASQIALTNPGTQNDADKTIGFAADAATFAAESRAAADLAAAEAAAAAAMIAALP